MGLDEFIKDNLYTKNGELYWSKQKTGAGQNRRMGVPCGTVSKGYKVITFRINKKQFTLSCHRVIWFLTYGYWPKNLDHKDCNGLNNSIDNLRECCQIQNSQNRRKGSGKSKYKGVHFFKGKWVARIQVKGERKYLGSFESEEEAAKAYDNSAKFYFGNWANLNFKKV